GRKPNMIEHCEYPSRRKVIKTAVGVGAAGALTARKLITTALAAGRTVKIGIVSPQTGPLAAFGEADEWVLSKVRKALANGIAIASAQHPVEIIYRDSQSNANRASEVTAELIDRDKIDIMVASSTGDTVVPVADQCELNGVPCITSVDPWEDFFFGRKGDPAKGFEWTYHFFWGF